MKKLMIITISIFFVCVAFGTGVNNCVTSSATTVNAPVVTKTKQTAKSTFVTKSSSNEKRFGPYENLKFDSYLTTPSFLTEKELEEVFQINLSKGFKECTCIKDAYDKKAPGQNFYINMQSHNGCKLYNDDYIFIYFTYIKDNGSKGIAVIKRTYN